MRNNSIYDFYDRLTTDRAFAGELEQFFQTKTISSPDDEVIDLAEFAANHGYDITMESITDFAEKQCQALTPEEAYENFQKVQWDGETGTAMIGECPWVWIVNLDHAYFIRDGLNIGNQYVHPHGSNFPFLQNIQDWTWTA